VEKLSLVFKVEDLIKKILDNINKKKEKFEI